MQIEANCPYWVWVDEIGYCEGMLLGQRDAFACETDVALVEWLGNIWDRWGRCEPWWEVSGDGGETVLSLQLPVLVPPSPMGEHRFGVSEGNWILKDVGRFIERSAAEFLRDGYVVGHLVGGLPANPAVDLQAWCSVDEDRWSISRPWTKGEWTYATDGKAAIRVSATGIDYTCGRLAPFGNPPSMEYCLDVGQLKAETWSLWVPLPEVERTEKMMQCPDCDGSGKGREVFCECCEVSHRCGSCDACEGAKQRLQPLPVVTGSGLIAWAYYERLRALPECEIGVLAKWEGLADSRISFRFAGGDGLVMGVRWPDCPGREREWAEQVMAMRGELIVDSGQLTAEEGVA